MNSAGWPAASMALRMSAIGDEQPVEVSLCSDADCLDLFLGVLAQIGFDRTRIGADAPVGLDEFGLQAEFSAIFFQRVANCPVSTIRTRSPGESVLTSAPSQAPVPVAV